MQEMRRKGGESGYQQDTACPENRLVRGAAQCPAASCKTSGTRYTRPLKGFWEMLASAPSSWKNHSSPTELIDDEYTYVNRNGGEWT
jgi:hypothetical protein